uniref:Uncharacterized protein n=1 Tax=Panagrolaimus superbus TaxID=310955 RepID=A0A914YR80_9BILA
MRKPPRGGDGYRARIDDDYDTGEYDYGQQQQHIPRSRTYDRAGIGLSATTLAPGMQQQNSCYNCASGTGATADWNINSSQQGPQGTSNGYISDTYATTQMSSRYYSQRPHSATAIRKDPLLESDGSPLSQQHQQRYRTRPRHRHSQDPSAYRMSPLNSPYGPPDEPQPLRQKQPHSRRYEAPPMDPIAPLPPQHQSQSQQHQQQQQQSMPLLPPHMQSYSSNNGEYGSDGSETMSVNSAQSMQNRQIIRQQQQQQSHHHQQNQQQQHQLSEDGEGSSNSLRHQRYVNDDYAQNISMEEATQSDTTMKSGAQALKEMKERKKSLMTRLIPGRGAGAGMG